MDVDKDNFDDALAALEKHLPQAKFVALDLEMTGITGPPQTQLSSGDVPQEQYSKARMVVDRYSIVQVGLSLFEETAPGRYECRPFSVYCFPRPVEEREVKTDPYVGLSASTVAFLLGNGVDFQRWVSKGVSYVTAAVEEALQKIAPESETPINDHKDRVEPNRPADVQLVKEAMRQVEAFVQQTPGAGEMKLPPTNPFLALVLRQRIAERYPKLVVDKRPSPNNPNTQERWVLKLDDDARQQRSSAIRKRLTDYVGFRHMWKLLKSAQKPLVLHNGLFDLLFLWSALEGPLPPLITDFKAAIHKELPPIFDTKVLSESTVLSGRLGSRTALPELSLALAAYLRRCTTDAAESAANTKNDEAPDEMVDVAFSLSEGFRSYPAEPGSETIRDSFHTAGFDAYQTGRIFAFYRAILGDAKTEEFAGRVFLMFSAFELRLGTPEDRLVSGGIARYLYSVDTNFLNNKSFPDLLKPVLDEGRRRYLARWCGDGKSLILIICGQNGDADFLPGSPGRQACEFCLDGLLQAQEERGRLQVLSLEEHLQKVAEATGAAANAAAAATAAADEGPPTKRRR